MKKDRTMRLVKKALAEELKARLRELSNLIPNVLEGNLESEGNRRVLGSHLIAIDGVMQELSDVDEQFRAGEF